MDAYTQADEIAYQACNMYNKSIRDMEGGFTMYSHDRFSSLVIHGIAEYLLEQGCTPDEIKYALAHKAVRWGLDADAEIFSQIGRDFAENHDLRSTAKEMEPR